MAAQILTGIIGIWLTISPHILSYSKRAENLAQIFGPIIIGVSIAACFKVIRKVKYINLLVGIWIISAPLFLNFENNLATINYVFSGMLVSLLSMKNEKR